MTARPPTAAEGLQRFNLTMRALAMLGKSRRDSLDELREDLQWMVANWDEGVGEILASIQMEVQPCNH